MATGHSFVKEVEKLLKAGQLFRDVDQFSQEIGLIMRTNEPLATDLVLRSACLAKSKADAAPSRQGKSHFQDWSRRLARALNNLQLYDRFWIEQYIFPLPPVKSLKELIYTPADQPDIRLKNPSFPIQRFDEGTRTPTKEEEEKLLFSPNRSEDSEMDIGPDPDILLGSPTFSCWSNQESTKNPLPDKSQKPSSKKLEHSLSSPSASKPTPKEVIRNSRSKTRLQPARANAKPHSSSPVSSESSRIVKTGRSGSVSISVRNAPEASSLPDPEPSPRDPDVRQISAARKRTLDRLEETRAVVQKRAKKERRRNATACLVKNCKEPGLKYLKVHAYLLHIPGIFDTRLPPDDRNIYKTRVRALEQAVIWLAGKPASIEELIPIVNAQHLLEECQNIELSEDLMSTMKSFSRMLGVNLPKVVTISRVNCVGALLHWRVLLVMVALMTPEDQDYWRKRFPLPEDFAHLQAAKLPAAVDSHFHLDRLSSYARLPSDDITSILEAATPKKKNIEVVTAVANYCDPGSYPRLSYLQALPPEILVAVGIHPKHASRSKDFLRTAFRDLDKLLSNPRVVAVGEFGLDHSVKDSEWPLQNEVVREMKKRIQPHHVVVLHCRSMHNDSGLEVNALLMSLLRGLPRMQPLHIHSFMGTPLIARLWIEEFPKAHFSFNRSVGGFNAQQKQALAGLEESRILLETDAPYFPKESSRFSSPSQLLDIAEMVAHCRRSQPLDILKLTADNALRLYKG